jgi:hypothetical protein
MPFDFASSRSLKRMKMIFLFLTIAVMTSAFFQDKKDKYLYWQPEVKLQWSDFHGHIRAEDMSVASASYIGFLHKIIRYYHPDSTIIDTRSFFNKSKSWVKIPNILPSLLSHEQKHFDLAELYARKFRKSILESNFRVETFAHAVDSTYNYYSAKDDSVHVAYDNETEHGLNVSEQAVWDKRVENELNGLIKYESPFVKLSFSK